MNAALQKSLAGLTIPNGWTIDKALPRPVDATGSQFSTGFVVTHLDGRRAFLKVGSFGVKFSQRSVIFFVLVSSLRMNRDLSSIDIRDQAIKRIQDNFSESEWTALIDMVEGLIGRPPISSIINRHACLHVGYEPI